MKHIDGRSHPARMDRRQFIRCGLSAALGFAAAGCAAPGAFLEDTPTPAATAWGPTLEIPTVAPGADKAVVGIVKARDYNSKTVFDQLEAPLDGIGGIGDVVRPGARVGIKVNLTGGVANDTNPVLPAIESYITHPEVVNALCKLLRDGGAKEITIFDGLYDNQTFLKWGYTDIANLNDARLLDLCVEAPYPDFMETPAGTRPFIYEQFLFNRILTEIDTFISVAKMKCHYTAGVTHSLKNLVGLAPVKQYQLEGASFRSAFHGTDTTYNTRLPRVIVDLNRARSIHLALIDGIMTTQGGEGPWVATMEAIRPGLLIAGKDAVAVDSVATAAMGFNPDAVGLSVPFVRCDNHLAIAAEQGLGTNRLSEIKVCGSPLQEIGVHFKPAF